MKHWLMRTGEGPKLASYILCSMCSIKVIGMKKRLSSNKIHGMRPWELADGWHTEKKESTATPLYQRHQESNLLKLLTVLKVQHISLKKDVICIHHPKS